MSREIYINSPKTQKGVIMSKKVCALLLLVAAGSATAGIGDTAKAGRKWLGERAAVFDPVTECFKVVLPARRVDSQDPSLNDELGTFKSDALQSAYLRKRTSRWVAYPINALWVIGAFWAGKKLFGSMKTRRMKNKDDQELAA